MTLRQTKGTAWTPSFAILACCIVGQAIGQEIQIVSPSETADVEGDESVPGAGTAVRVQFFYPAADFMTLPSSHRTITSLAFRPDESNAFADPVSGPLSIRLSTTDANELSETFAANIGDDETVVFDRIITWQTEDFGPGPRDFDYIIPFDTPFSYDPTQGRNLVLDFLAPSNWDNVGNWVIDRQATARFSEMGSLDLSAMSGFRFQRLWPTQFTFIPEPSTTMLSLLTTTCLAWAVRRRR